MNNTRLYFGKDNLDSLPEESGIYFLYQAGNILVYIGKANCIRRRVTDHDKDKEFIRVGCEITHRSRARTLEKELLAEYSTKHGQLPLYNKQH